MDFLNRISIRQRIHYLIGIVAVSIVSVVAFVFFALSSIEGEYDSLQKNSTSGALHTLEIQMNLNYVSRTTRDIMLGGDYDKNIAKLEERVEEIRHGFDALEAAKNDDTSLALIKEAKESTMRFLENSMKMMHSLTHEQIANETSAVYANYHETLTPYANASRDAFKKVVILKEKELEEAAAAMHHAIASDKIVILVTGIIIVTVVLVFASMVRVSITETLTRFAETMKRSADGDFKNNRIEVAQGGVLSVMADSLERLVTQTESFISEINTSISNATRGDFERPISDAGMQGAFVEAIGNVRNSIELMKEQELKKQRDALNGELSVLNVGVTESMTVIQHDLAHNIESLKTSTELTKEGATLSEESRTNISTIVSELHALNEQVAVNNESIGNLASQAGEITSIIELITDIAGIVKGASEGEGLGNQFLATIREADAIAQVVRGFDDPDVVHVAGVVDAASDLEVITAELALADEVRKLAERTHKATGEISVSIKSLQQEMSDIQSSAETMTQVVERASGQITGFEETLVRLNNNATNIVTSSYNMENSLFIVLAKIDHILYKSRAYNSVMSGTTKLDVLSPHECRLGKWYDDEGKRRFGKTGSYSKMAEPHRLVHENANANIAYINDGIENSHLEHSDAIIGRFKAMEKASNELFSLMDSMLQELKSIYH